MTDFPDRFEWTRELRVEGAEHNLRVESSTVSGGRLYLSLAGVSDRAAAEALRGKLLLVPAEEAVPLPPGRFYWHQIIGLTAVTTEGRALGRIREILQTGANDVYVVATERGELLLPAIRDVVRGVDLERGVMTVDLIPGLEA